MESKTNLFFEEIVDPLTAYRYKKAKEEGKELFDKKDQEAALATFLTLLSKQDPEPFKPIDGYDFPRFPDNELNYLAIRTLAFIEATAAKIGDNFENAEIVCGCVYRKDHSKKITDEEIYETALFFKKQPLSYAIHALRFLNEMSQSLHDIFPVLYDSKDQKGDEDEHPYKLINTIAQKDLTKWDKAKQMQIKDTFIYLQDAKIEWLNEKNKHSLVK